jgi:hypothetical protein
MNDSRSRPSFVGLQSILVGAGVLTSEDGQAGDHLSRKEALEILLRCLEKSPAYGQNLACFDRELLCSDFNRVFASPEAAARADREAREAALAETAAKRKAAEADYARATRTAGPASAASGSSGGAKAKKRIKRRVIQPVVPVPRLDPGFEALSRSDRSLTRAEACLLLASSFRIGHERTSALQRAAARVATASSG